MLNLRFGRRALPLFWLLGCVYSVRFFNGAERLLPETVRPPVAALFCVFLSELPF